MKILLLFVRYSVSFIAMLFALLALGLGLTFIGWAHTPGNDIMSGIFIIVGAVVSFLFLLGSIYAHENIDNAINRKYEKY